MKTNRKRISVSLSFGLILCFVLSACETLALPPETNPHFGSTPTQLGSGEDESMQETPAIVAHPTETPLPTIIEETPTPKLWIEPHLPEMIRKNLPSLEPFELTDDPEMADFRVGFGQDEIFSQWIFAIAAPFKTVTDQIHFDQLSAFWQNKADFPIGMLVMDETTFAAMQFLLGENAGNVRIVPAEEVTENCLTDSSAWAILPFEELSMQCKVIAIDDLSPIHKDFAMETYPLRAPIGFGAVEESQTEDDTKEAFIQIAESFKAELSANLPAGNRSGDKLTTVIMTGVTALVRATAKEMEIKGVLYPGEDVREVLREADITHVSNEVPFYSQCPEPQWTQERLVFCSATKYMDLLLDIGTDVVDLTGDHFADFGSEAMNETLDMYDEHHLPYFGGGRDIHDAVIPAKFEVNGNKIAFLGCNGKAPGYARVSETEPGAYSCRMDDMVDEVHALVAEGYLPIFTFQHIEYYHWAIEPYLAEDFRRVAEAGAVVVSGSQGHQPHAYEFHENAFVHYGLGNLFFDQYGTYDDTDKAFLDRYVFYDGKLISIELLTMQFFDWSKPTWTSNEMREYMLTKLFEVSDLE